MRLRHRPDSFEWRGDRWAYHRIADGDSLSCLDRYSPRAQTWCLHSGRVIEPTGREIRDIIRQVHWLELPDIDHDDERFADMLARIEALERLLAKVDAPPAAEPEEPEEPVTDELDEPEQPDPEKEALRAEVEALRARNAELEAREDPPAQQLPPLNTLMSEYGAVGGEEGPSDGIPDAFRDLMMVDETPEKFTERMRRRMQYLKHMQIDGSKPTAARALPDMTDEERNELADLEERNRRFKWLD